MTIEETWLLGCVDKARRFGATMAVDIGANVGEWTNLLAQHFDMVVAVEPDPRAYRSLSALESDSVMCINAAVLSRAGAVDFHLREHSVQSSLLQTHPIGGGNQVDTPPVETISVAGETIDSVIEKARRRFGETGPLFIKVDVEGSEGDVLAGATDMCFRGAAWLIEIHDRRKEVGLGLHALGYDGIMVIPHPIKSAHPRHEWLYTEPNYDNHA